MEIERESILKSATRSFIKSLMTILGIAFGVGIVIILLSMFLNPGLVPPPSIPTVLPDAEGNRKLLPMHTPALAVLRIDNVIGTGSLTSEKINTLLLDAHSGILDHDRLKGVLLFINSPGGLIVDTDNIYRALMQFKENYKIPIFAYVDGLCASGGFYIACTADKILSSPSSIIGSVGVRLGPMFNVSGAMDKIGLSSITLTQGKNKDAFNPFRPWVPGEGASIDQINAQLYDRFVSIVLKARPQMTQSKLVDEYGAQVFLAQTAKSYGYIDDADASYEKAIDELSQAAGIEHGDAYQVIELSPPSSFLDQFSQTKVENLLRNVLGLPQTELQGKLLLM